MRNGKYESYKKSLLVYYFYYTLAIDNDWKDMDKVLGLQKTKLAYKKIKKIPPASRNNVIEKLILYGLIIKDDHKRKNHARQILTEKGIKEAIKIMW